MYLTDPVGGGEFDEADERVLEALAPHGPALAVVHSQRQEPARGLSIAELRARLARHLPDSVTDAAQPVRSANTAATLTAPRLPGVGRPVEAELFKVSSEAISNALQHSGAGRVEVVWIRPYGGIRLTVRDDGVRIAAAAAGGSHLGLASMPDRVAALGGRFELGDTSGRGDVRRG